MGNYDNVRGEFRPIYELAERVSKAAGVHIYPSQLKQMPWEDLLANLSLQTTQILHERDSLEGDLEKTKKQIRDYKDDLNNSQLTIETLRSVMASDRTPDPSDLALTNRRKINQALNQYRTIQGIVKPKRKYN